MSGQLRDTKEIRRDLAGLGKSPQFSLISEEYAQRLAGDVAPLLDRLEAVQAVRDELAKALRHFVRQKLKGYVVDTLALILAQLDKALEARP